MDDRHNPSIILYGLDDSAGIEVVGMVSFPPGALACSHNRGIIIGDDSGELAANALDGDVLDEAGEDAPQGCIVELG